MLQVKPARCARNYAIEAKAAEVGLLWWYCHRLQDDLKVILKLLD